MTKALAPDSYGQFLADLKGRIRAAQLRASMAVNRELVLLYWQPRYPQPAGAGKLGRESDRPSGGGPQASLARHDKDSPRET